MKNTLGFDSARIEKWVERLTGEQARKLQTIAKRHGAKTQRLAQGRKSHLTKVRVEARSPHYLENVETVRRIREDVEQELGAHFWTR